MDYFMLWVLPILALALLFVRWRSAPSGWRKWYYIVLMLILIAVLLGKNVFKVF